MQRYLISYQFYNGEKQEKGGEMLVEWYEAGGPENRPDGYNVDSWIFLPQNGKGFSVVTADSLETIWRQWRPWRLFMDITIEPCADLEETIEFFK